CKVLRLALQRGAAYGSYNRAISGICIDEIIRQHGDLDTAMKFLRVASLDWTKRDVWHPITGINLLNSVSGAVWRRISKVTQHYLKSGEFPADPMSPAKWAELNPGRYATSLFSYCGIESCGREPSQFAGHLLRSAKEVMNDLRLKGPFDYYLVPCAPSSRQVAHTSVYISLPRFDHLSPYDVAEEFRFMLRRMES
ncbi:MAG: hypothetical protein KDD53_12750, partial [Bdellovibrionales bacterium]|nr:hypothetical protein [Bdellovibrionales bacterium]